MAEMLQLKTYVLRFWETEFPQIAPLRTEKGQRVYTEKHVAILRKIQQLLHEQGMTIDGARRILEGKSGDKECQSAGPDPVFLEMIRRELGTIRNLLSFSERQ